MQSTLHILQEEEKRPKFFINDHIDILIEILKRLDGRSLSVASCVCRAWCNVACNESLWENLCFRRHVNLRRVRPMVVALGGYKKLYMVCMRPVLSVVESGRVWRSDDEVVVQLSLSLFCVDYYQRLHDNDDGDADSSSSLMLLCRPVNVG